MLNGYTADYVKAPMEKHSTLWSYITGISTAVGAYLTLEKFALIVGIITTILTFGVNWYYRAREYRLREKAIGK